MAIPATTVERNSENPIANRFWQHRESWVKLYTTSIAGLGTGLIFLALQNLPTDKLGLLVYISMGVITELLSVELFANMRGSRVSAAAIISIAGVLTFGPLPGALINTACGLASSIVSLYSMQDMTSKNRASFIRRSLFNIGMLTLSSALAGFIYIGLGGAVGDPIRITNAAPLFAAVLICEFSNIIILIGVILLQTGQPLEQIWEQNFRWGIPISIVGGALGSFMIAMAHTQFGMIGLALFFLPVLAIGYSFRLYINNIRIYVNRLEQANTEMEGVNIALLETLGSVIDAYDMYTYGHSTQVAAYTSAIADQMGISGVEKSNIVRAALVHDIGKVGVMDNIIGKPGRLTDQERQLMERHPIISAEIIRRMKGLHDLVPLVRHHHERWDGQGYPAGLLGEEIPLGARVIALADAVDAMCSSRPYRKAMKIEDVKEEIQRNSGIQFDPQVVESFLQYAAGKGQTYFKDSATIIDEHVGPNKLLFNPKSSHYLKRCMLIQENETDRS